MARADISAAMILRLSLAASLAGAGAWTPAFAASPRPAPECRTSAARSDRIEALGQRGELILASGGRAILSGLRWPEEPDDDAAAASRLLVHRGQAVTLTARGDPDRWGRLRVEALIEGEATDIGAELVAAGYAAVDAGEGDVLCRPALLQLEQAARAEARGIWRRPRPATDDGISLRARYGRFVVAQGRLVGVGERSARTYLDFVRRGQDGLTVTVSKRTWRHLQERGLSAASLRGRLIRVRGVIDVGRGPSLDIASADMIEVLDEERAPRR
ncbi:thermonuclease family protein [Methylobacterium sp.]|uniref:thermonuclease family protein n=1 Tax=Methylobacterium sp. TaxID=409 RepID=UPI0025E5266F|nr:thermonuclease family protein [Methylobacterium sp.]